MTRYGRRHPPTRQDRGERWLHFQVSDPAGATIQIGLGELDDMAALVLAAMLVGSAPDGALDQFTAAEYVEHAKRLCSAPGVLAKLRFMSARNRGDDD